MRVDLKSICLYININGIQYRVRRMANHGLKMTMATPTPLARSSTWDEVPGTETEVIKVLGETFAAAEATAITYNVREPTPWGNHGA